MVLEGLLVLALRMVQGVLFAVLPDAPYCYDGASALECPAAGDFSALTGLIMSLDVGIPVSDAIVPAISSYLGLLGLLALFGLVRAVARWMPSWLTGGG